MEPLNIKLTESEVVQVQGMSDDINEYCHVAIEEKIKRDQCIEIKAAQKDFDENGLDNFIESSNMFNNLRKKLGFHSK